VLVTEGSVGLGRLRERRVAGARGSSVAAVAAAAAVGSQRKRILKQRAVADEHLFATFKSQRAVAEKQIGVADEHLFATFKSHLREQHITTLREWLNSDKRGELNFSNAGWRFRNAKGVTHTHTHTYIYIVSEYQHICR
jgi:hypothetical protein